jgi:HNH endonuclease
MEGGYWYVNVEGKKIAFHRYVMELHLGRKLTSNEVVHHIDGDPLNNDPDNLALLSRSEHQRLHACASRRPWTVEEDERVLKLREAGMKIWEVAVVLGRPFSTTARHLARITKESRLDPALP